MGSEHRDDNYQKRCGIYKINNYNTEKIWIIYEENNNTNEIQQKEIHLKNDIQKPENLIKIIFKKLSTIIVLMKIMGSKS